MVDDETHDCRLVAMQRPSRRAGSVGHLDPARRSQERLGAAAEAAWRGAEGRNTWPTLQCDDEGTEGRAEQLWWEVKPEQTTRLRLEMFDVRRGQGELQRARQPGRTRMRAESRKGK
jgi:hypothetical protein